MNVKIVGDGVFGTFLKQQLTGKVWMGELIDLVDDADIVILAVPASAYEEVAKAHAGKCLVNVCSVQEDTTNICLKYSDHVISVHPMFGPRSPDEGKTCLVTYCPEFFNKSLMNTLRSKTDSYVLGVFRQICSQLVFSVNGEELTPKKHDEMMAKTHLKVVEISDHILQLVENAKDVPEECLPTSFKRLKAMAEQFLDMPAGTKQSILSNKY